MAKTGITDVSGTFNVENLSYIRDYTKYGACITISDGETSYTSSTFFDNAYKLRLNKDTENEVIIDFEDGVFTTSLNGADPVDTALTYRLSSYDWGSDAYKTVIAKASDVVELYLESGKDSFEGTIFERVGNNLEVTYSSGHKFTATDFFNGHTFDDINVYSRTSEFGYYNYNCNAWNDASSANKRYYIDGEGNVKLYKDLTEEQKTSGDWNPVTEESQIAGKKGSLTNVVRYYQAPDSAYNNAYVYYINKTDPSDVKLNKASNSNYELVTSAEQLDNAGITGYGVRYFDSSVLVSTTQNYQYYENADGTVKRWNQLTADEKASGDWTAVTNADDLIVDLVYYKSVASYTDGPLQEKSLLSDAVIDVVMDSTTYDGTGYKENITGTAGNDTIKGAGASDTIKGGVGNDVLYGSDGVASDGVSNTFVFAEGDGTDTIMDAKNGDIIRLEWGLDDDNASVVYDEENHQAVFTLGANNVIKVNFDYANSANNIDTLYVRDDEDGDIVIDGHKYAAFSILENVNFNHTITSSYDKTTPYSETIIVNTAENITITGLDEDDEIVVMGNVPVFTRSNDSSDLVINGKVTVGGFFTNGEDIDVVYGDGDDDCVNTANMILNVELSNDHVYAPTNYTEHFSGVGSVAATALMTEDSDALAIAGTVTYERTNNGDLHVKGTGSDITVTGFDFENATKNIYVNGAPTSVNTVIDTTVSVATYAATAYKDHIIATADTTIAGMVKDSDTLTIGGELAFSRYASSNNLTITGAHTVVVEDFFATEGDITVDNAGTYGNALAVTADVDYVASDNYIETITMNGAHNLSKLGADDNISVATADSYVKSGTSLLIKNGETTLATVTDIATHNTFNINTSELSALTLTVSDTNFDASEGFWNFGSFNITGTAEGTLKGGANGDTITAAEAGSTIYGNGGADVINGGAGTDIIYGGAGNDTISGADGNDTFIFNAGDGVDSITDAEAGDVIKFGDKSYNALSFERGAGWDLVIKYSDNDKVIVENYFYDDVADRIDDLITLDSGVLTEHKISDLAVFDIVLDEVSGPFDKAAEGYAGYKVNILLDEDNATGYVSNLEDDDNITLAGGSLKRTWQAGESDKLTVSDGTNSIVVTDYFTATSPALTLNNDTWPTSLDVTLNDTENTYVFTDFVETVHGTGLVAATALQTENSDKLLIEGTVTYQRTNNGDLHVIGSANADDITVTGFVFDGENDIYVNDGTTAGMTIGVILTNDLGNDTYTAAASYAENITVTATNPVKAAGLSSNDNLDILGEEETYALSRTVNGTSDGTLIITTTGGKTVNVTNFNFNTAVADEFTVGDAALSTDLSVNITGNGNNHYTASDVYTENVAVTTISTAYINNLKEGDTLTVAGVTSYNKIFWAGKWQLLLCDENPRVYVEDFNTNHGFTFDDGTGVVDFGTKTLNVSNVSSFDAATEGWGFGTYNITGKNVGTLKGADNADTITAAEAGSTIYGNGGNDSISGAAGVDEIHVKAGDGTDTLTNVTSADKIYVDTEGAEITVTKTSDSSVRIHYGTNETDNIDITGFVFDSSMNMNIYVKDGEESYSDVGTIADLVRVPVTVIAGDPATTYDASSSPYKQDITVISAGDDVNIANISNLDADDRLIIAGADTYKKNNNALSIKNSELSLLVNVSDYATNHEFAFNDGTGNVDFSTKTLNVSNVSNFDATTDGWNFGTFNITGDGTLKGGAGNDTITGVLEDCVIYGNGGDDVINASYGYAAVDVHVKEGDGTDTVTYMESDDRIYIDTKDAAVTVTKTGDSSIRIHYGTNETDNIDITDFTFSDLSKNMRIFVKNGETTYANPVPISDLLTVQVTLDSPTTYDASTIAYKQDITVTGTGTYNISKLSAGDKLTVSNVSAYNKSGDTALNIMADGASVNITDFNTNHGFTFNDGTGVVDFGTKTLNVLTLAGFDAETEGWGFGTFSILGQGTLKGGDGADTIGAGGDSNIIYGNGGNDSIVCGDGVDEIHVKAGDGSDTLTGISSADKIYVDTQGADVSVVQATIDENKVLRIYYNGEEATDRIDITDFTFADRSMDLSIYIKNGETTYADPVSIYDLLTVFVEPETSYNAASVAYKQEITVSGTVAITNLTAKDDVKLAGGALSRVWDGENNNTLTITSGNNVANITDYFSAGSTGFKFNGGDLPAAIDVTLNDTINAYAADDNLAESIHGTGKVFGMGANDKITTAGEPVYTRTNDGGLFVDNVEVTDFDFSGGHDINVNAGTTEGITINVTVTGGNYTAVSGYAEKISGNGTVSGATSADRIVVSANAVYSRTAGDNANDLVIVDGNNTIVVENYFTSVSKVAFANAQGDIDIATLTLRVTGFSEYDAQQDTFGVHNIVGTAGVDTITGGVGANTIEGLAGNDTLTGNAGADKFVFNGEFGKDTIVNAKVDDIININAEFDVDNFDSYFEISGNDLIVKVDDSNEITIKDYLVQDKNNRVKTFEVLDGDGNPVTLTYTGAGIYITPEEIQKSKGRVIIPANSDEDVKVIADEYVSQTNKGITVTNNSLASNSDITGSYYNDVITLKGGNNTIVEDAGTNKITTGAGDDVVTTQKYSNNTIAVGAGDNTVTLNSTGTNKVTAGNDDNIINANKGINNVTLGTGDNQINITDGTNTVKTGKGNNTVAIFDGINKVTTGAGDDMYVINGGNNTITSGAAVTEYDTLTGAGADQFRITEGSNIIKSTGYSMYDITSGVNTVTSGAKNDIFNIVNGKNNIKSGGGIDTFTISGGANAIDAGAGDDVIDIRGGKNTLNGGAGNDTYKVDMRAATGFDFSAGEIIITDVAGKNKLDLAVDVDGAGKNKFNLFFDVELRQIKGQVVTAKGGIPMAVYGDMIFTSGDGTGVESFGDLDGIGIANKKSITTLTLNGSDYAVPVAKDLDALAQDVASWLLTNNYMSTAEALSDTNPTANINDLIAKYTTFSDQHFNA